MTVADRDIRKLFEGMSDHMRVSFGEPMSGHTTLRIGGPADVYAAPRDVEALGLVLRAAREGGLGALVVGGGSNLLVGDRGMDGVAVSVEAFDRIEVTEERGDRVFIKAEAGLPLAKLVAFARKKGLSGAEGLVGIPGRLGGAVAGNAGAFGSEMKDMVRSATVMTGGGDLRELSAEEMSFGYRRADIPAGSAIVSVDLVLLRDEPREVARRMEEYLKEKKRRQPLGERSAGCVFKNPPGLPAGRLIDEAGCKGMRQGAIEVSGLHANFFINTGGGTADDFLRLMDAVATKVKGRFGVDLEPEIKLAGRC
ncbi:MAG: UDP-N-acetylmuramate dehydrogenase [Thermodesulfovibrionales bacterium]